MLPLTRSRNRSRFFPPFSPALLFAQGEQGAWYDPSDYSTLFQDSAGTTPVTGVEQFVGLMLDKSGRGNHAFQTTSAKRPKLAARYNLLTYSEEFSNGAWKTTSATKTSTTQTDPNGGSTAALISIASGGEFYQDIPFTAGLSGTFAVYVKKPSVGGATAIRLTTNNTTSWSTGLSTKVTLTSDWQLVTLSGVLINSGSTVRGNITCRNAASTVDPDCIGDVLVAFADLRPASQATGLIGPTYQRVAAATVYDTAGFLPYLAFDGLSWSMGTNSIDPGAVDKAQVFAGVRKLSDAAQGAVAEFSATIASNNGTFLLAAPDGATQTYGFDSKGTTQVDAVASSLAAPRTNVVTGLADIAGDSCVIRVDGAVADTETGDQGTGNFLTYPLFIGGRNNASLFFNGWLSSLIVRFGANLSQSQIEATEAWVNGKTGAY
jgi:hypothetical protein